MEQIEFPSNVIDQYGDSCELGNGEHCFGPSLAIQKFVADCKKKNIAIADGEAYKVEDGKRPIVIVLGSKTYERLCDVAITKNLSPQQFLEVYTELLMDEENEDELEEDLEKVASNDSTFGVPETWGDSDEPPPVDSSLFDEEPVNHQAKEPTKRRISRPGLNIFSDLSEVLHRIHKHVDDTFRLWIGMHKSDEVQMNIEYPTEGVKIKTSSSGKMHECLEKHIDKLNKWESIMFGPKLEEGTEVKANIGAEILGFDKSIGKYKVKLGENIIVDIDPEDISSITGK